MAKLESILHFLGEEFQVSDFPDYPHALNGLQVEGPPEVRRLVVAVDASEVTIHEALAKGAELLLVHHGLFWDGFGPITGPRFRKVKALIQGSMALYALHLPLDAHAELGNCALLTRALGLKPSGTFAPYKGVDVGCWAVAGEEREVLRKTLETAVGGPVRLISGGPEKVDRVGILTGSGASALQEAADGGMDALITGEAAHHNYHDAMEYGVNLYLAGHYATETFGVKALGETLADRFDLEWSFLDFPTGL
jgi:dinuclear metal center YbgI/SA1388 family protein